MKAGEFMKYTRLEIYKGISNSKLRIIFGFFILIPLIAVMSGCIISRLFITGEKQIISIQNEDNPIMTTNKNINLDYKIFFLQAGAFMGKNNAESLKNSLKNDSVDPVVIEDDDIYRVTIQISDDKDLIIQEKDKLQALGYNCLINEFNFASIDSSGNEEIETINKLVNSSVEIIKITLKINSNFEKNDLNNIGTLREYILELNNIYNELEKINPATQLKTYKNRIEQYTNDYIKSYENEDIYGCKKNTGQMVLLLSTYYNVIAKANI